MLDRAGVFSSRSCEIRLSSPSQRVLCSYRLCRCLLTTVRQLLAGCRSSTVSSLVSPWLQSMRTIMVWASDKTSFTNRFLDASELPSTPRTAKRRRRVALGGQAHSARTKQRARKRRRVVLHEWVVSSDGQCVSCYVCKRKLKKGMLYPTRLVAW